MNSDASPTVRSAPRDAAVRESCDERVLKAIGKAALDANERVSRVIGLFDYTPYGEKNGHVVRDYRLYPGDECVFSSRSRKAAQAEYDRRVAVYIGEAALAAFQKADRRNEDRTEQGEAPQQHTGET